MARKKKVKEEVVEQVEEKIEAPVEEIVEIPEEEIKPKKTKKSKTKAEAEVVEEPKKESKVEVKAETDEFEVPEMPETFKSKKNDYNIGDVIRKYIGSETARIYEGDLSFNNIIEYNSSRYNVIIGDLDLRKIYTKINFLPKVIFGNIIVNDKTVVPPTTFLGGKIIKK